MPITYDAPGITFGALIEEITSNLQGYTAAPDQMTALSQDVGVGDTTLYVDDPTITGRGVVEIGTEQVWVQTVNPATNQLDTLPKGRGWRGTTATTHQAGDTVVASPAVPRSVIARDINNQIRSLYPDVYAVNTTEFAYDTTTRTGWPLPAEAVAVLDVRWRDYQDNWQRIKAWEAENSANLTDFPTGKSVRLPSGVPVGRTVQVVYAVTPTTLTNEVDPFSSTGLSDSAKDLVVLGTMARVVPNLDVSRLSVEYAAASETTQARPHGGAITVAKFLEAKYAQRVRQERAALNQLYPARIHFTR